MPTEREKSASQLQVICIEDLVHKNHMLRKTDKAILYCGDVITGGKAAIMYGSTM